MAPIAKYFMMFSLYLTTLDKAPSLRKVPRSHLFHQTKLLSRMTINCRWQNIAGKFGWKWQLKLANKDEMIISEDLLENIYLEAVLVSSKKEPIDPSENKLYLKLSANVKLGSPHNSSESSSYWWHLSSPAHGDPWPKQVQPLTDYIPAKQPLKPSEFPCTTTIITFQHHPFAPNGHMYF